VGGLCWYIWVRVSVSVSIRDMESVRDNEPQVGVMASAARPIEMINHLRGVIECVPQRYMCAPSSYGAP
jgi:hypothetical protein